MGHQKHSQMRPVMPVARNADCQPWVAMSHATKGGAMMAPTDDPLLKMPDASARSLSGNHSATSLMAAGQLPASPMPSNNRERPRLIGPTTNACMMEATDHQPMQSA